MAGSEADLSQRALDANHRIERLMASGHTIRALVELRALLEEGDFWIDPDRECPVRSTYLASVHRFAGHGVSESELHISLHA